MEPEAPLPPSRGRAAIAIAVTIAVVGGIIAYRVVTDESSPASEPDIPFPTDLGLPDDLATIQDCFSEPIPDLAGDPGGDPAAQIEVVADDVERIRELEFRSIPDPEFIPQSEVTERVKNLLLEEYSAEDADSDERILVALGAMEEGVDLRALLAETLGAQVVGFYVPETEELVVSSSGSLGPSERITLAHELEHALADQAFEFPTDREIEALDDDAALAFQSLAEGDATVTQNRYAVSALSLEDQLTASFEALAIGGAGISDLPHVIARQLTFPYIEGMAFVCDLYDGGGWKAVDRAYRNPPTTSAHILFPSRYRNGETVVDPTDPGPLPVPWEPEEVRTVGAADLLWLFEAPGNRGERALDEPLARAAAWAGGEVQLWTNGRHTAVGIALAERTEGGLCESMSEWYAAAFPGFVVAPGPEELAALWRDTATALSCPDGQVRLGIAPDLDTARRMIELPLE